MVERESGQTWIDELLFWDMNIVKISGMDGDGEVQTRVGLCHE